MNWEKWMMEKKDKSSNKKGIESQRSKATESERMQEGTKGRKDEPAPSHNANTLQSMAAKRGRIQYMLKKNWGFKGGL